eukprot:936459_1
MPGLGQLGAGFSPMGMQMPFMPIGFPQQVSVPPAMTMMPSNVMLPSTQVLAPVEKMMPTVVPKEEARVESTHVTLWVGKVPSNFPDRIFRKMLQECGKVTKWTRVNRATFGFVEYDSPFSALRALRVLKEVKIDSHYLKVKADTKTKQFLDAFTETAEKDDKIKEIVPSGLELEGDDISKQLDDRCTSKIYDILGLEENGSDHSQSRSRSRSKSPSRSRHRSRSRPKYRSRSKHRSPPRSRHESPSRSPSRTRHRSRSQPIYARHYQRASRSKSPVSRARGRKRLASPATRERSEDRPQSPVSSREKARSPSMHDEDLPETKSEKRKRKDSRSGSPGNAKRQKIIAPPPALLETAQTVPPPLPTEIETAPGDRSMSSEQPEVSADEGATIEPNPDCPNFLEPSPARSPRHSKPSSRAESRSRRSRSREHRSKRASRSSKEKRESRSKRHSRPSRREKRSKRTRSVTRSPSRNRSISPEINPAKIRSHSPKVQPPRDRSHSQKAKPVSTRSLSPKHRSRSPRCRSRSRSRSPRRHRSRRERRSRSRSGSRKKKRSSRSSETPKILEPKDIVKLIPLEQDKLMAFEIDWEIVKEESTGANFIFRSKLCIISMHFDIR